MLNIMRQQAQSWLIKVLLGAIVVVFVFWGVGSFTSRQGAKVAEVNGKTITVEEYRKAYDNLIEQYRQQFGGKLDERMLEMLKVKQQVLNRLVDEKLLLNEAERLSLRVAPEELSEAIVKIPAFQDRGTFNTRRYRMVLNNAQMTPEEFEESQRQVMLIGKLRDLITAGVAVSESEAMAQYNYDNERVNIRYVRFSPDRYKKLTPTDEEVTKYFEDHKENYRTEPKIKARYLIFDPKDFTSQVTISEDDIRDYYESNQGEFEKEQTVQARHILLKLAEDADPKQVEARRAEAQKIADRARAGEDFATLAKTFSEGPTKDRGGDLGTFKRGDMVKPFSDKAFSMKPGEISDPVRTRFGWHVIKVEKVSPATTEPLEQATGKIREKLVEMQSQTKAFDRAEEIFDVTFNNNDLAQVAAENKLSLITSGFFSRSQGTLKGVTNRTQFADKAFELPIDEISDVLEIGDKYYLVQVIEKQDSQIPELASVKEKVTADVLQSLQKKKAMADAETLLADLKKGQKIDDAAKIYDLKPADSGLFKRDDTIEGIGSERSISTAAFQLYKAGELPESVIQGTQGVYVFQLLERKVPDPQGFAEERQAIEERLLQRKQYSVFNTWMAELKSRSEVSIEKSYLQ